jgi:succinoglycan biosynthesis transport protein ExoP
VQPPHSGDGNLPSVTPSASQSGGNYPPGTLVPIGPMFPPPGGLSWPGAAPQRPTFLTSGPDPVTLLHSLRRRWILAIASGIAAATVVAALAWFLVPADFEVQALFEVRRNTSFGDDRSSSAAGKDEHELYKKSQLMLVKSPFVIQAALRPEGIAQLPTLRPYRNDMVKYLTDEIMVDYPSGGDILRIRMRGENVDDLVKIVDAVKTAYLKEVVDKEMEYKRRRRQVVNDELLAVQAQLKKLRNEEARLNDITKSASSEGVQFQVTYMMNELNNLRRREFDLYQEIIRASSKIEELKGWKAKYQAAEPSQYATMKVLQTDPRWQSLQMTMQSIDESVRATKSIINDPNSPRIKGLLTQKAEVEAQMDELRLSVADIANEMMLGTSMGSLEIDLAQAENNLKGLEASLAASKQESEKWSNDLRALGGTSAELLAIAQEAEMAKLSWQELDKRVRDMDLDLSKENARVQLMMDAQKPDGSEWVFKYFLTALCSMGAFGLTVFGITYGEFQTRRISTASQVADGLGMKVVGALPSLTGNNNPMLQTILNESIDRVRTLLLHASSIDGTKIVMVTSAVDQEGKTTVASQLAASLARCGRRTLIVDADIRSPSLHELFDMPAEPGLCEVLRTEMELDDAIRPTRMPGLWLLPSGRCDAEAVQALAKDAIGTVFEGLRPEFDFIILDTAPVLTVADSLSIGQHVDAAIVAVLRDVSQGPKVFDAVERLRGVGINVMGAVVNGETQRTHRRLVDLQSAAT